MKRGSLAWAGVGVGTPSCLEGERSAEDCLRRFLCSREEPMKEKSNILMLERSLRLKAVCEEQSGVREGVSEGGSEGEGAWEENSMVRAIQIVGYI